VPYTPPPGWIETFPRGVDQIDRQTFHADDSCSRIVDRASLRAVTRPGAATRCWVCAPRSDRLEPARRTSR
jgi:hypothetical protein